MPLPRRRNPAQRISWRQRLDLVLGREIGAFCSDDERGAAWSLCAAELMRVVNEGTRPQAWWDYMPASASDGTVERCV